MPVPHQFRGIKFVSYDRTQPETPLFNIHSDKAYTSLNPRYFT